MTPQRLWYNEPKSQNSGRVQRDKECGWRLWWYASSFCEEVGVVEGVHLLSGKVRSVATALKVVEEVQEEVQEVKDE